MLWSAILFGVLGALIGLRYRAPALIPATFVALAWGVIGGLVARQSIGELALLVVVLAFALHVAYLAGLALRTLAGR